MSKVVPITGKFTTFSSMLGSAMADETAKRGFVVIFDEDGTMRFGEFAVRRSDICMASAYLNMIASDMMRSNE